jgi:3-phenylpropionate/trans-cinnamate dioxygenase ferredoxin reductase subunit
MLFGDESWRPYERPPLSKDTLQGGEAAAPRYLHDEGFYDDQKIELRLGSRVGKIDRSRGVLVMDDGDEVAASQVLLCTGTRARKLSVPGADLEGIHYLRTHDDALQLAKRLAPSARVVIIGMGVIGAEVAASAVSLGCSVTAIEPSDVLMERAVGRFAGAWLAQEHIRRGTSLRLQTGVERFIGHAGRLLAVETSRGERIEADIAVIGVGVVPADELARDAGLRVDNGIVIDAAGRSSCPEILAAGDVASQCNFFGEQVRMETYTNAYEQAVAAAATMAGEAAGYSGVPYAWSDQFDVNIQIAGRTRQDADMTVRGDPDGGSFSVLYQRAGVLEGIVAINRPRDISGGKRLISQRWRGPAEILADAATDLRKLKQHQDVG